MKFKDFIESMFFHISVPKCVACSERLLRKEKALCKSCFDKYTDVLMYDCSLCGNVISKCDCSNAYLKAHYIRQVFKVYRYLPELEPPSNMLIYKLKRENRSDVVNFLADEIYKSILNKDIKLDNTIITNVPRRKSSVRKYGFDHSKLLAKALAKKLGIKYFSLLISKAKKDQKQNKGREERIRNADFDYCHKIPDISNKNVILVDDIITTGASMGACATLIHGLGAKKIFAAAIAIAYKDEYTPFLML